MKKFLNLFLTVGVGMTTVSSVASAASDDKIRAGVVLYKIKEGAHASELKSLNALKNSHVLREEVLEGLDVKVAHLKSKGNEKAISKLLRESGAVTFAEPDMIVSPSYTPNDTDFTSQWHHDTINSTYAWDTITSPNDFEAVKVCVLDTGVDTDHPDLAANLLPGYNANGLDSVEDYHGHGTGTAGVIGAVGNNGEGVSGTLWDVNIIPVQINIGPDNSSAFISTMATGIKWCADQGVKVANLSYAGVNSSTIDDAASYLKDRGGLLFMSSGNSGTLNDTKTHPDWSSFIIVGSTGQSDTKSSFSEYGPYVDLVAPGESIRTTYLNGQYVNYSGTSFSSPVAAGVGALIYGVNANFTPDEVENILLSSTVDLGDAGEDDLYGKGRIDAQKAVALALEYTDSANQSPVPVASVTYLNDYAPRVARFIGIGSTDDGIIMTYRWDFGDGNHAYGSVVEHTYVNPGQYFATLTVTDDNDVSVTSKAITIEVSTEPSAGAGDDSADSGFIDAPSTLLGSVNTNQVTLSWTDNSENESGFIIERGIKVKGKFIYAPIGETLSNVETFTDTVDAKGQYVYRIKAVNETGSSAYSNEIKVQVKKF